MSVQELSSLHRRYVDLSNRFRAVWAFHQLVQSLQKVLMEVKVGNYAADFQQLYSQLKEVSHNLSDSDTPRVREQLDAVEERIGQLTGVLAEEDSKVSPYSLRHFFQRVKQYDEKILIQLVRFYLYQQPVEEWDADRRDKADFLCSRLGEVFREAPADYGVRDRRQLREMGEGFWALVDTDPPMESQVEEICRKIDEIGFQISQVEDLEQLKEQNLVRRYRELKHGLGSLYFQPDILLSTLRTNLALKEKIGKLYHQEERRIVAEYQQIFDLEREAPVDLQLEQELSQFHQDVARFEKRRQREDLKLDDLSQIRERARALMPRLTEPSSAPSASPGNQPAEVETEELEAQTAEVDTEVLEEGADRTGGYFQRLVRALEDSNPHATPRAVALSPELFSFRLEPREVMAFRRLTSAGPCDRELERFLLEAAAVRCKTNDEAEEITGLLDETAVTGEAPVFQRARHTLRVGSEFLWRFIHLIDHTLTVGEVQEAREFQLLRMRLVRCHSGLWLLVHRPRREKRPSI